MNGLGNPPHWINVDLFASRFLFNIFYDSPKPDTNFICTPATEAVPETAKPMSSVPVFSIKKSKGKSKKPKLNEESDIVSSDPKDSATLVPADSRKGKKLRADRDSSPAVSSKSKRPEDWIIEERVRIGGSTAGSKDKINVNLLAPRFFFNIIYGNSPKPDTKIGAFPGTANPTPAVPVGEPGNIRKSRSKSCLIMYRDPRKKGEEFGN